MYIRCRPQLINLTWFDLYRIIIVSHFWLLRVKDTFLLWRQIVAIDIMERTASKKTYYCRSRFTYSEKDEQNREVWKNSNLHTPPQGCWCLRKPPILGTVYQNPPHFMCTIILPKDGFAILLIYWNINFQHCK